jgi:spore germination protein YaaH/flagellar hook assembly protein FlgD
MSARRHTRSSGAARPRLIALAAAVLLVVGIVPAASVRAAWPRTQAPDARLQPTVQYEEAMAHAADKIAFAPGARVTVPFKPRVADRWVVGGVAPKALPAGRLSGKAIREGGPASRVVPAKPSAVGPADLPNPGGSDVWHADLAAAVDPGGLKREVFGFLPYWELTDSSTRLDWEKLSTIAYFGVGAAGDGTLQKANDDGSTTVGWSGWTSSRTTAVINAAHANGARVVLTVQSFGWSSSGVTRQKALLGSSAHRLTLARQIAAAVRDRGADGVNLDFEPIVSTYADEFTALVRSVRAELNRISRGYQLTFDATGWIGNYPIEVATASGAADAVVIMGYDYKNGSSNPVGSVAPLGGAGYDIGDTIKAYVSRVPASKVILGVPYYGRAWSTATSAFASKNISSVKNGASTTVVYGTARQYAADHGRKWDPVQGVAWTVYRRENCTATDGCVKPWREIYYDDAKALGLKYDAINRYNLRGAGIWALGYDGTRTELYAVLKAKFITDTVPPVISAASISSPFFSPNGDGRMDAVTVRLIVTGHIQFGWVVQRLTGGTLGPALRSGSHVGKVVAYTWDGKTAAGTAAPDGTYRITLWAADASNNRASASKDVTIDRRPVGLTLAASSSYISPNGDRQADQTTLSWAADEPISGTARLFGRDNATVRRWTIAGAMAGSWVWNGKNAAGATVADGRYTLRLVGLDRAGNQTTRELQVRVDRTIRSLAWARSAFTPRAGQKDRFTLVLRRKATVTVAIYQGSTLVRRIWTGRAMAAGTYGWTWNGRSGAGSFVKPGSYKVVVDAVTSIGPSRTGRSVTVRAP